MLKILDIILFFLLVWGGYSGFRKGFILELFSIGSLFIAIIGSIKVLNKVISFYTKWYGSLGDLMPYILFVLIFILIIVAVTFAGRLLKNLINLTLLGSLDQLAGAVLGIFKWAFLVSSLLWIINLLHLRLPTHYTDHTILLPLIQSLAPRLMAFLPTWLPALKNWFDHTSPLDSKPNPI